jgi:hypothetical protein
VGRAVSLCVVFMEKGHHQDSPYQESHARIPSCVDLNAAK